MTVTHGVYAFLVSVSFLGFVCRADLLPPVSEISYEWIDPFTVNVSWTWGRPADFPTSQKCDVQYIVYQEKTGLPVKREKIPNTHFIESYLTGETGSDQWEVKIQVVTESCGDRESLNKSKTVTTMKPKGLLVKDFKCVLHPDGMNCSWIPLQPALNMSYSRNCENTKEHMRSLKRCDRHYSDGMRSGCSLEDWDVCVLVETDSHMETFKPTFVIPVPKMSIREHGYYLNLTLTTPDITNGCEWDYQVCYKECGIDKDCQNIRIPSNPTEEGFLQIVYDDRCRYEFKFQVKSSRHCLDVLSDGNGFKTYGSNRPPVRPLNPTIVIGSILSIVLSVCLVLTCYCFKRHRDILCPNIPDPQAILKEMMATGSKEFMPTSSHLYMPMPMPMPELVESCELTPVTENSIAQEKSQQTVG